MQSKSNNQAATPTGRYVTDAPPCLIHQFEAKEIRNGRLVLGRLLQRTEMKTVWKRLAPKLKTEKDYRFFWSAVVQGMSASKRADTSLTGTQLRRIFGDAATTCRRLRGTLSNLDFDPLIYELVFDPQLLQIWGAPNLHRFDGPAKNEIAGKVLGTWPSLGEILAGLEFVLQQSAQTLPNNQRRRTTYHAKAFAQAFGPELKRLVGRHMYGTVADITNVVLNLNPEDQIERGAVQRWLDGVSLRTAKLVP